MDQDLQARTGGDLPPALRAVRTAITALRGEDLQGVDSASVLSDVAVLRGLLDQCEGEWLRRVGEVHARGAADAVAAGSTKAFLRGTLLMSPFESSRAVRTASALRSTCPATAQALASGQVGLAQASVVAHVVDGLPSALADAVREQGEQALLAHATSLNAADLARADRFLANTLDPQGVARDEREAIERSGITFAATLYGAGFARGDLDAESLALIQEAIEPLSAPAPDAHGRRDGRTAARRRLDALKTIVRHYLDCRTQASPRRPGAHLAVVTTSQTLTGAPAAPGAHLQWGGFISPEITRRLACDAQVTPVLTGPLGQVLDVGRRTRVVTPAQWTALVVRDQRCAFPGCDAPPSRCDAHHIQHWADGGPTALNNLVLLCDYHHQRVLHDQEHTDRWQVSIDHTTGRPVFTPPAWTGRLGVPLPPLWRPPPAD